MMRALLIGLFMLLSACTSTGQVTPQSVLDFVKANCGFAVQLADLAALISANPGIASAATLGDRVCQAINAQVAAAGTAAAAPPTSGTVIVDGVPIHWTT